MHIKDHSAAMKFFRTYDNAASKGKWKEFVDEMEFDSMLQEPRTMAQEPRNMYAGGQLVQNTADGSRPGYSGDKKRGTGEAADIYSRTILGKKTLEAQEKGLVYDRTTGEFRKERVGGTKKGTPSIMKGVLLDTNPGQEFLDIAEEVYSKKFGGKKGIELWKAIGPDKRGSVKSESVTGKKGGWKLPPAPEGKIHQKELIEMITETTGKEFKRSGLSFRPGKKDYIVNKIGELLNRTTGTSKGKAVYYLFDKPTVAQLDFIGEFINAPHLMDRTVRNMKILDKEFGEMIANAKGKGFFRNELTIDRVKDAFKKAGVKDMTNSKAALAMTRYGQSLQGKLFKNVEGITKNAKAGDFIFQSFNELDQYHPWRQGSYQAVLDDINKNMGNKAGKLGSFKTAFKEKMQKLYPKRDFVFNEIFSISTSANRGSYPYAYFVDLTEHSMNSGALSSFQGKASIAEGRIQDAIKNYRKTGNLKFHKEAQDIAKIFNNKTRKEFLSSEKVLQYQKDYGIKPNALKIEIGSQRQIKDKLNFAKNYYSNKNLEKWRNLGIDIDAHTGKSGYIKTFGGKGVPKNVITAGELFTEDTRLGKGKKIIDEKALDKFLGNFWCGTRKASGGRISFATGSGCPDSVKRKNFLVLNNDVRAGKITGEAAEQIAKQTSKVVAKAGSKSALASIFGPYGIGIDVIYEVGAVGIDMYAGKPWKEAVQDNWIAGAFMPGTSQEEFHKRLFEEYPVGYEGDDKTLKYPEAKPYGSGLDLKEAYDKKQKQIDRLKAETTYRGKAEAERQLPGLERDLRGIAAQYNALGSIMEEGSPEHENYMAAVTEVRDADKAKSKATKAKLKMELDRPTSDRAVPYKRGEPVKIDFKLPKPVEISQTPLNADQVQEYAEYHRNVGDLEPRGELPQWYVDEIQNKEKWRQLFEQRGIRGSQDWKGATGGIASLKKKW